MVGQHKFVVALFAMSDYTSAELVIKEDDKQEFLEWLYKLDKRHRKSHPKHGLYTGLAQKYKDIFAV